MPLSGLPSLDKRQIQSLFLQKHMVHEAPRRSVNVEPTLVPPGPMSANRRHTPSPEPTQYVPWRKKRKASGGSMGTKVVYGGISPANGATGGIKVLATRRSSSITPETAKSGASTERSRRRASTPVSKRQRVTVPTHAPVPYLSDSESRKRPLSGKSNRVVSNSSHQSLKQPQQIGRKAFFEQIGWNDSLDLTLNTIGVSTHPDAFSTIHSSDQPHMFGEYEHARQILQGRTMSSDISTGRLSIASSDSSTIAGSNALRQSREMSVLKTKIKMLWTELEVHERERSPFKQLLESAPTQEMRITLLKDEVDKLSQRRQAIFAVLRHIHNREVALKEIHFLIQKHEARRITDYRAVENKMIKLNQIMVVEGQKIATYIAEWRDLLNLPHHKPFIWEKRDYEKKMQQDVESYHQSSLYRYLLRGEDDDNVDLETEEGNAIFYTSVASLRQQHEANIRAARQMQEQVIQEQVPIEPMSSQHQQSPSNPVEKTSPPAKPPKREAKLSPKKRAKSTLRREKKSSLSPIVKEAKSSSSHKTHKSSSKQVLTKETLEQELFLERNNLLQGFLRSSQSSEQSDMQDHPVREKYEFIPLPDPEEALEQSFGDIQREQLPTPPRTQTPLTASPANQSLHELLSLLDEDDAAARIQRCWRRYNAHKTTMIETDIPEDFDITAEMDKIKTSDAALRIQSLWRGYRERLSVMRKRAEKENLQEKHRVFFLRHALIGFTRRLAWDAQKAAFEIEQEAANTLLSALRMAHAVRDMDFILQSVRVVQQCIRRDRCRRVVQQLLDNVVFTQNALRQQQTPSATLLEHLLTDVTSLFQSSWEQQKHNKRLQQIVEIQTHVRAVLQQTSLEKQLTIVHFAQSNFVALKDKAQLTHARDAIVHMQSEVRRFRVQKKYLVVVQRLRHVVLVQAGIRSWSCHRDFEHAQKEAVMQVTADLMGEFDEEMLMDLEEVNNLRELNKSGIVIHIPQG